MLLLIASVLNAILGVYIIYNNPRNILNISLSIFSISAAGWMFSIWSILNISDDFLIGKMPFIFVIFGLAFLAIFTYEFEPKILHKDPYIPIILLFIPNIFTFLTFSDKIITSVAVKDGYVINTYGGAYPAFAFMALAYILFSLFFIFYKYRNSFGIDKMRLKYVFLGLALMLIPSSVTNLILPLIFRMQNFNSFGPISSTFMIMSMTYAIVRYHLMDIWIVIRLGTIFALVFSSISFIYIGGISLLSQYIGGTAALLLTSFFVVISFEPLKKFIEDKADRIFFSKHYNFDQVIEEFTSMAHHLSLDLEKILISFAEIVKRNLKVGRLTIAILKPKGNFLANSAADGVLQEFELPPDNPLVVFLSANPDFILNKDEILQGLDRGSVNLDVSRIDLVPGAYEELVRLNFTLAMPIVSDGRLIAIYFIGSKKSNDFFTNQDLQLLDHLTGEVGVLINNARLYEDLKKLDEAKSNFISVVSHQLRTPLSAMRWTTELLLAGSVDKGSEREFLKDAYKNSLFMIYQLDDMLIALEVEDRDIEIKSEKCVLTPFIEEIMKENEVVIQAKKLDIKFSSEINEEAIFCDHKKIKKVIEILIRNAINYAPDLGGKIEIDILEKVAGDARFMEISVSDNGIGISPDEERYIFEKFFRGEEAKKISPNGFGLGLFIVRAFARAHGGEAHFESAGRNKGTRFYFTVKVEAKPLKK